MTNEFTALFREKNSSLSASEGDELLGQATSYAAAMLSARGSRGTAGSARPAAAGSPVTRAGAEATDEEFMCLGVGEHIQGQGKRALDGDQAGELAAAGHDHQAAGTGRKQRADLLDVPRVVQEHQRPLAGLEAAVQARLRVQACLAPGWPARTGRPGGAGGPPPGSPAELGSIRN